MMEIRVLIAEDEPLERDRLRALIAAEPELTLVAECANGDETVAGIAEHQPDLIFLDVQMPGLDAFGVIEKVGADRMPATVFVTAYDRYALRAFDVHALDYLLKPFNRQRFQQTLRRARSRLRQAHGAEMGEVLRTLLRDVGSEPKPPARLLVKSEGRILFLRPGEVDWVEAAGNYARLHVGREVHLLRETMADLEAGLPPGRFVRIHRSTIVNIERIQFLEPSFHGDYVVRLHDGTELVLSRTYRPKVEEALGRVL